ncbi:hypothetical protein ACQP2E_34870 [Actinoplanes sp. CA-015351]|uniref:hypothetical protein n=1 Tax=Actinoplanes sp. CA-015351 TaxID=3239897 RepID=UPI003D988355
MNRRDVLTNLHEGGGRPHRGHGDGKPPRANIELDPADHEEPTWEVHRPGTPRRRFDRRARMILTAAAVAALLANAGAAWAYWRFNQPDEPTAAHSVTAGVTFAMALNGTSDPDDPSGDLTVTVTNQHPVPIRITAIRPGAGRAMADDTHRDAGCSAPRVRISQDVFPVSWEIPRNTVGAFVLDGALSVRAGGQAACKGASYSVPMRAEAIRP